MPSVRLTGYLVCRSTDEVAVVIDLLPHHIELTHAEPGCMSFTVSPTSDPFVWRVDEEFVDDVAFAEHQRRARTSDWGVRTAGIERRYTVQR